MKVRAPSVSDGPWHPGPDVPAMRQELLGWHVRHGRSLRFRGTTDAWLVLVSEVMAQQTQIARVEVAWTSFTRLYSTPAACATASTAEVLRAWAGLGYNRRAVNLQRAAQVIVGEHDGRVPCEITVLETLPGVGPYTARAVAAIAFGEPVAALDTNIRRVVGRLVGMPAAPARELQAVADELVDAADPAAWTHAAMDLGASVCVARVPRCAACPLRRWCVSAAIPARTPSPRRPASPPFEKTSRWLRGRIVAHLRDLEHGEWAPMPAGFGSHDATSVAVAVDALVRDGLVERRADGAVRLPSGPA